MFKGVGVNFREKERGTGFLGFRRQDREDRNKE